MKAIQKLRVALIASVLMSIAALLFTSFDASAQQDKKRQDQKQPTQQKPGQKPGQKPDEETTIKLGTQLVNVLFAVQDKQNRYINDLKQEDVEVLENGQPQQIFTFKRELDLPLTMALLIDVSGSERYTLPLLKDAGSHFVDSVIRSGKDTVGVIKFEGEPTIMQDLTSNPARVRRALEEI